MITPNYFIELILSTFTQSKYTKWYNDIVSNALLRVDYSKPKHRDQAKLHIPHIEAHHICPISIFPDYKKNRFNLVYLTPREHFIVHFLLFKMAKKENRYLPKLAAALSKMRQSNKRQIRYFTSGQYNILRVAAKETANHMRMRHPLKGIKQSKETIEKRKVSSKWFHDQGHSKETKEKISKSRKDQKASLETRQKMSNRRKGLMVGEKNHMFGKKLSNKTRKLISDKLKGQNHPGYGKPRSNEVKQKLSEARKGKYKGEENGMFGVKHSTNSLTLMSINKFSPRISNLPFILSESTWNQFLDYTKDLLEIKSTLEVANFLNLSTPTIRKIKKNAYPYL